MNEVDACLGCHIDEMERRLSGRHWARHTFHSEKQAQRQESQPHEMNSSHSRRGYQIATGLSAMSSGTGAAILTTETEDREDVCAEDAGCVVVKVWSARIP